MMRVHASRLVAFVALLLWSPALHADTVQGTAGSPAVAEAIELQKQGRTSDAIALLQRASEASPADAVVQNMLASLLNREGRYPEALPHAQAAVAAAPENARYRLNRGIVLVEHGRFEDAIADFNEALERDRSFVYGYLERGSAQLSLDRDAEARAQWARARQVDPALIWPDWYEGLHDFIDGRYLDAVARLDRVAAAEPAFGPAAVWRNLARARARLPLVDAPPQDDAWPAPLYRLLRGQAALSVVLKIAGDDRPSGDRRRVGETLFVAAEVARAAGRTQEARSLYQRAVAVEAPRHAWKVAAGRALTRSDQAPCVQDRHHGHVTEV